MRNLMVGQGGTVLVNTAHEMLHDVLLLVRGAIGTTVLDDVHVDFGDSLLSVITLAVPGERGPVKHEVDRCEAHVKIVVERGQGLVEPAADFVALEAVGGSENGDLGHVLRDIDDAGLALEKGVSLEVGANLVGNDGNIRLEGIGGKGVLDEL